MQTGAGLDSPYLLLLFFLWSLSRPCSMPCRAPVDALVHTSGVLIPLRSDVLTSRQSFSAGRNGFLKSSRLFC